jgi:hypothetical protein
MPYPTITRAEARSYLKALREGVTDRQLISGSVDEGDHQDWDAIASDIVDHLTALSEHFQAGAWESEVAAYVHQHLPAHPALSDPEFWTWFAVRYGRELISWRYGDKADLNNYGVGSAGENLLYRLWLRGEIARQPDHTDPYELARVGDVDFWRSHLFRQGYGDVRVFAQALLKFQFPKAKDHKARLSIAQVRDLAKRLRRARSNLMFEVMDEPRAALFIESEWAALAGSS